MKGGARCKATSPDDHAGKTVLHSLELEHTDCQLQTPKVDKAKNSKRVCF